MFRLSFNYITQMCQRIFLADIYKCLLVMIVSLMLAACGGGGSSNSGASGATDTSSMTATASNNSGLAGTYSGTENLEGGNFPITIVIDSAGMVTITDVDGISASGTLQNNQFRIVRNSPRQIFEGEVNGETITGVTTENFAFGDGTFQAVKQS